jgi:hypothetical protein
MPESQVLQRIYFANYSLVVFFSSDVRSKAPEKAFLLVNTTLEERGLVLIRRTISD